MLEIRDVALELFEAGGYEHTTVGAIAERAGVSRRTFFRYYPSKADVLFAGHEAGIASLRDELAARRELPLSEAWPPSLRALAFGTLRGKRAETLSRLIESQPEVRQRNLDLAQDVEAALAEDLLARDADPASAAMAAAAFTGAMRAGQREVRDGHIAVEDVLRRSLQVAHAALAGAEWS